MAERIRVKTKGKLRRLQDGTSQKGNHRFNSIVVGLEKSFRVSTDVDLAFEHWSDLLQKIREIEEARRGKSPD